MKIAIACDHAGLRLKKVIIQAVEESNHAVIDLGTFNDTPVDYPDFAEKLGMSIRSGEAERGILVCGSGVGACVAANKMKGIYAAICHDTYSAHQGVEHDDINVLCLGSRVIGPQLGAEIVKVFLAAEYLGNKPGEERHLRRVNKIKALESHWDR